MWFWWLFPALVALLLVRNRYLFSVAIYEEGDAAANSILVANAKQFSQLVGNYSRIGFHHPGPGFLYIHALGEWLLYDVTGVVPSPWNGQAVAVLVLNAALVALAVTIVCRWLSPVRAPMWARAAVAGTALVFLGSHNDLITSTWPPFEYFAPYLLLLAAGASVAAGGLRDLWAVVFAAGLLIHGHAEFLFLATLLASVGIVAPLWRHRDTLAAYLRSNRWHLLGALAVALFMLAPIVVNLVLHWPGEFGHYLSYGNQRQINPIWKAGWYVTKLWDANQFLAMPVLVGSFAAVALAARISRHPYVRWGLTFAVLGVGSFLLYAVVGIDAMSDPYIGFFTRALPLFLLLLAVAATIRFVRLDTRGVAAAFAIGGLLLGLYSPALVNRQVTVADVPAALEALVAQTSPHQPVVVTLAGPESWAEALPLALAGNRRGVRICFADESVELMATEAYLCRAAEVTSGLAVTVSRRGHVPVGLEFVAELNRSRIWTLPEEGPHHRRYVRP